MLLIHCVPEKKDFKLTSITPSDLNRFLHSWYYVREIYAMYTLCLFVSYQNGSTDWAFLAWRLSLVYPILCWKGIEICPKITVIPKFPITSLKYSYNTSWNISISENVTLKNCKTYTAIWEAAAPNSCWKSTYLVTWALFN